MNGQIKYFFQKKSSIYFRNLRIQFFDRLLYSFRPKVVLEERRPCTFGQSLGRPIVQSISHFFWSTKKKLSSLRDPTKDFGQSLIFLFTLYYLSFLRLKAGITVLPHIQPNIAWPYSPTYTVLWGI